MWWGVFWLLTLTLLALGRVAFFGSKDPAADDDTTQAGEKKEVRKVESPLNTFFSIAVLLLAFLLVCYRAESKPRPDQPPPNSNPKPHGVSYKRLESIRGFLPGKSEIPGRPGPNDPVIALIDSLGKDPQPGDRLLLLGSADCTKVREGSLENTKDNKALAEARAKAVSKALGEQWFSDSVIVNVESLDQYNDCNQSKDLRAVFPILIQHQP